MTNTVYDWMVIKMNWFKKKNNKKIPCNICSTKDLRSNMKVYKKTTYDIKVICRDCYNDLKEMNDTRVSDRGW